MDRFERARRRIVQTCREAKSPSALLLGIERSLEPDVGVDRWCAMTFDPATSLPTGGVHDEGVSLSRLPRLLELEFGADGCDVNRFADLARSKASVATMGAATAGRNATSARYRDVLSPDGIEHELRVVFRDGSGAWGGMVLMRGTDVPDFDANEVAMLASVTDEITRAMRRVLLLGEIEASDAIDGPALLLLDGQPVLSVQHASPTADRWLAEIDDGSTDRLPYALYSLAVQVRRTQEHLVARIRTRRGRWLTAHADPIGNAGAGVSLILQPSRPHEVAQVLASAYGLTVREGEVVRLVAAGCSNAEIAKLLFVSRYTVQDHLKNMFAKVGVNSRSELVSKLFFDQYLPRTNAGRVIGGDGWFTAV